MQREMQRAMKKEDVGPTLSAIDWPQIGASDWRGKDFDRILVPISGQILVRAAEKFAFRVCIFPFGRLSADVDGRLFRIIKFIFCFAEVCSLRTTNFNRTQLLSTLYCLPHTVYKQICCWCKQGLRCSSDVHQIFEHLSLCLPTNGVNKTGALFKSLAAKIWRIQFESAKKKPKTKVYSPEAALSGRCNWTYWKVAWLIGGLLCASGVGWLVGSGREFDQIKKKKKNGILADALRQHSFLIRFYHLQAPTVCWSRRMNAQNERLERTRTYNAENRFWILSLLSAHGTCVRCFSLFRFLSSLILFFFTLFAFDFLLLLLARFWVCR